MNSLIVFASFNDAASVTVIVEVAREIFGNDSDLVKSIFSPSSLFDCERELILMLSIEGILDSALVGTILITELLSVSICASQLLFSGL